MNEILLFLASFLGGAMLGCFFFAGLWWTVEKGLRSDRPALWFLGSTLLRTGFVVVGFYFISSGEWRKLLVCLVGFFLARIVVTRFTRTTTEGTHASK
jgi:F1F0 ATPase subunit 2